MAMMSSALSESSDFITRLSNFWLASDARFLGWALTGFAVADFAVAGFGAGALRFAGGFAVAFTRVVRVVRFAVRGILLRLRSMLCFGQAAQSHTHRKLKEMHHVDLKPCPSTFRTPGREATVH